MPSLVSAALPAGMLSGSPQPVVTGGITLRPWSEGDIADLVRAYADPDIQRWHCRSLDDAEAGSLIGQWREAWRSESGASWAIVPTAGGKLLGRAGFRTLDLSEALAEVAYWVLPDARGRGVATAAVVTLSRWAFGEVGLHRLELCHSVGNMASCRVAAAAGYTAEGTLRQAVQHADGWHDMHVHARLATDSAARC